ncbi:MAG: HAMP domain-containing sensor histidine kinase [Vicinamibacterales bacterium]
MLSLRSRALAIVLVSVTVLVSATLLLSRQVIVSRFDDFVQRGQSRDAANAVTLIQSHVDRTHSLAGIDPILAQIHDRTGALVILFHGSTTIAAVPALPDTVNIAGEDGGVKVTIRDRGTQSELVLKGKLPEIVDAGQPLASVILVPRPGGERREFNLEVNRGLWWVALGIGAFGMLLGGWLAGRLVRPVERMKVQNEQLRRSLLNDVAHELRTPLTHVRAELEALQDGLHQPTREVIDRLHADALHLGHLVDDLRDLAEAEAGQLRLALEMVDAHRAVSDAVASLEAVASAKAVRLLIEPGADRSMVTADPARLRQVLDNLLDNAIRHAPAASAVTVTVEPGSDRRTRISVSDQGAGVPADQLPRLFDRFFRADESRDRRTGGAGLGLAIVKQLVTLQGGSVEAVNLSPRGFRVSVILPHK